MTAYRFRVKFDPDPTSLWRDVVVGSDRTLEEFQTTINAAMGIGDTSGSSAPTRTTGVAT